MKLLSVNYHYIEDEGQYPYPAIFPTPVRQLEKQLKILGEHFSFISCMDILHALNGSRPLPLNACVVTFDDGLRSQFVNALPILQKLKIPATFFVSAKPVLEKKALLVNKTHYARAKLPPQKIIYELSNFLEISKNRLRERLTADKVIACSTYLYDDVESALLKWYLNFKLDQETRGQFIDFLFSQIVDDEAAWCKKTYMSADDIQTLARMDSLGNHTYDHVPLATLTEKQAEYQIAKNGESLRQITGYPCLFVSYPNGAKAGVSRREANLCKRLDIHIGFSIEKAINLTLNDPLLFARIDNTDAVSGKRNLMEIESGNIILKHPLTLGRTRYIREIPDKDSSVL